MDGGINRIERTGPQPAARVRRIQREPFTMGDVEPRDDEHSDESSEDAEQDDSERDKRPIAPRGDDESGARIDLTA